MRIAEHGDAVIRRQPHRLPDFADQAGHRPRAGGVLRVVGQHSASSPRTAAREPLFLKPSSGYPEARCRYGSITSITTVGMARQKSGSRYAVRASWLMDADGNPTNDPHVLDSGANGTLLPLGGRYEQGLVCR